MPECFGCNITKTKTEFSNNQWKKRVGQRKCKVCVPPPASKAPKTYKNYGGPVDEQNVKQALDNDEVVLVCDTETSGRGERNSVIQLSAYRMGVDNGESKCELDDLLHLNAKVVIRPEVLALWGGYIDRAELHQASPTDALHKFIELISAPEVKFVIWYNAEFDCRMMLSSIRRELGEAAAQLFLGLSIEKSRCAMIRARSKHRFRNFLSLSVLAFAYGIQPTNLPLHTAAGDVKLTIRVLNAMIANQHLDPRKVEWAYAIPGPLRSLEQLCVLWGYWA